ncbi:MAG: OmpA family protein [Bacteroidales bacterium]|nr:OmpA family protein [Bacteroidales bacterium]
MSDTIFADARVLRYRASLADRYKAAGNNPADGYLSTTAWYQEIGLEYYGRYTGNKLYGFSDNYKFKSTLSAMAELEIIYSLNIRLDIMAAIYGTYGITAVSSHGKLNLYDPQWNEQDWGSGIEHGNPDAIPTGEYAGLLNTGLTSKSHTASVGLMAGIRYRIGREARLEFEQHSQARHLHQTKQANMMNQSTHQFDKKKRKHFDNDETDSTLLSEEERRKRRIQQMEMERQQRIKDSLAALVVDTAQTQPAANDTPVPPKPDNSWSKELDDIINRINGNNQCAFNEESAAQNKKQRLDIDRLAEILTQHPEVQLDLYGHTCDIGTLEQNKLVGQRRADNFAQQLMDRGVSRKQLHCGTKWWKEPLVPNTSEANRKKNRRVEIIRR